MKTKLHSIFCALMAALIAVPAFAGKSPAFLVKEADTQTADCLAAYGKVQQALADDNLPAAQTAATNLAGKADAAKHARLASLSRELAKSGSIAAARQHFKAISDECIKMAEGMKGYHVFTCPMAKADWLQTSEKTANPYLGKKMPNCGEMKGARKAPGLPRR